MKVSVGLLALCLALCQATPGWEDGKEYIYEYEAKFGTGISDNAVTQASGRGIKGQVHVRYHNNELAVKYDNLKCGEFNRRLNNLWEVVELDYQPPTAEEKAIVDEFQKPFWGEYHDGVITASKHTGEAPVGEINPKRALLSLLQLNFPSDRPHDHFYVVKENGIGGDCDTSYAITHLPYEGNPGAEVVNITKNYYYDKCTYEPHQFFSSIDGYKCPHCKQDDFKEYRSIARVDYSVRGNRNKYTIERICANGFIAYTPFTTNGQTVVSITNQTLRLVDIVAASLPPSPADAKKIEGLYAKLNIEKYDLVNTDLKKNIAANSIFPMKVTKPVEKVVELLKGVSADADYHKLAENTDSLGHLLFTFSYEDWKQLFEKHVNLGEDATPTEKDRRNFLLKSLTLVGTNPSILYALELIKNSKVPTKIVVEMLAVLPFYAKTPTESLVDYYLEFMKLSEHPESYPYAAGWLAYGTLVYKACVKHDFNPHPPRRETYASSEKCDHYAREILNRIMKADSNEKKSIFIRALTNTQTELAFRFLHDEVIPNNGKYNVFIRAPAIWGLEHYAEHHPEYVMELLVPILIDPHEDYHLRMLAFEIILYTKKSPVTFANLAFLVNNDPSEQLASYIYSTLVSISNSTDPCHEDMAHYARSIIPHLNKRKWDVLRHSTNRIFSFFNEQYGYGRSSQYVLIASNNTLIPRELYMRQSLNFQGYNFDVVELGYIQRNQLRLESVLAIPLGQPNLAATPKTRTDDFNLAKHFNLQKLLTEGSEEFYSRLFNQDVMIAHALKFEKDNPYVTVINENKLEIHYTKVVSAVQMEYVVSNLLGLPTILRLHIPVIFKLDGSVDIVKKHMKDNVVVGVEIHPHLYFGASSLVKGQMEVQTPLHGAHGYELKTNMGIKYPICGEIDFNIETGKITLKKTVTPEPYDIVSYNTQPYTYNHHSNYLPVRYADKPIQRQFKFGHNYFGAGIKVSASYDYRWNDYGSYRTFIKSFFHKSTRYEDYYDLIDKWYAGSHGILDHAVLNPTARPFQLRVRFERSTTNPANEYHATWSRKQNLIHKDDDPHKEYLHKKIDIEITATGPVERKWNLDVTVDRHYPYRDQRILNLHYKRSAIPNYDDKPYEVCFHSEAKVEGKIAIWKNILKPEKEPRIDYDAILNVGTTCGEGSRQIKIKGEATKSEEQRSIDKEKLPIYQKCREDFSKGYEYSYACWKVMKDQGRVDHYKFDIEYSSNINPKVKELLYRLKWWFRHTFYNNLQVDRQETDVPENHVRIEANVSYRYPVADIHVKRPHEYVHYHHIFIPSIIPRYEPVTIVEPLADRYLRRIFNYRRTEKRTF